MNLPSNISTEFEDYCEGCPYIDLGIQSYTVYSDGEQQENMNTVYCKNRKLCKRLFERFEQNWTKYILKED